MDPQTIINVSIGAAGTVFGWLVRVLWEADKELRHDLSKLREELPETYARRDDVKTIRDSLALRFDRLELKIDRLVERTK